jgi:RNA polymerase sigma-70 factor (ECF subfamily)
MSNPMNGAMRDRADETLVASAREGNLEAFGELARRVQERIYAVIYGMTRDHQDTDDLMQETFLSAYRAIGRFGGRSSFYTWVYRIAVNLTLNHLRRKGREKGKTSLDERTALPGGASAAWTSPEGESAQSELRARLNAALAGLAPIYRAAFSLVVGQGMSHGEAAEVLGCSENTVSWRMHKARKMLRDRLKDVL